MPIVSILLYSGEMVIGKTRPTLEAHVKDMPYQNSSVLDLIMQSISSIPNGQIQRLREDIILKVWVSAKSESFPPTRFSMSHIFLRSDTNHHVQTQSQIWVILIFEENSEWKIEIITNWNYYEERKLRKWSFYEDSGIDLVPSHLIQFKPI